MKKFFCRLIVLFLSVFTMLNIHNDLPNLSKENRDVIVENELTDSVMPVRQVHNARKSSETFEYSMDYYFDNLDAYSPHNYWGTCSLVSLIQVLSYYDTFYNDSIIPEKFDRSSIYRNPKLDRYNTIIKSPGVDEHYQKARYKNFGQDYPQNNAEFEKFIFNSTYCNENLQINLLRILNSLLTSTPVNAVSDFNRYQFILDKYCEEYNLNFRPIFEVNKDLTATQNYEYIKNYIDLGMPVILAINGNGINHVVVAYSYYGDEIYANFGWNQDSYFSTDTRVNVGPGSGYTIEQIGVLRHDNIPHTGSDNYRFRDSNGDLYIYCGCGKLKSAHTSEMTNSTTVDYQGSRNRIELYVYRSGTYKFLLYAGENNAYKNYRIVNSNGKVITTVRGKGADNYVKYENTFTSYLNTGTYYLETWLSGGRSGEIEVSVMGKGFTLDSITNCYRTRDDGSQYYELKVLRSDSYHFDFRTYDTLWCFLTDENNNVIYKNLKNCQYFTVSLKPGTYKLTMQCRDNVDINVTGRSAVLKKVYEKKYEVTNKTNYIKLNVKQTSDYKIFVTGDDSYNGLQYDMTIKLYDSAFRCIAELTSPTDLYDLKKSGYKKSLIKSLNSGIYYLKFSFRDSHPSNVNVSIKGGEAIIEGNVVADYLTPYDKAYYYVSINKAGYYTYNFEGPGSYYFTLRGLSRTYSNTYGSTYKNGKHVSNFMVYLTPGAYRFEFVYRSSTCGYLYIYSDTATIG